MQHVILRYCADAVTFFGDFYFTPCPFSLCPFRFSRPTFLVAVPWNIRPGANVTVGVALLPDSPAQVTVRGEVIRDNETILSREMVFEKGKRMELAWKDLDLPSPPPLIFCCSQNITASKRY